MSIDKFIVHLLNCHQLGPEVLHRPYKNPYYTQGFYEDLNPLPLFRHFFKLYLTKGPFAGPLKNFAIHFKGLRRALMGIWSLKSLLSNLI
jgi:hypothetical protein